MKQAILSLAFLGALPLAVSADVTKEDIRKLVAAGISDDVILTFIRSNGPVASLSSDDLVDLKKAGASEKVLNALVARPSAAADAPPGTKEKVVERVVEKPVYVPRTTYVYDTTPTYYYSASPYYYSSYYTPTYRPHYYYPRRHVYFGVGYGRVGYGYRSYRSHCSPRVGVGFGFSWHH